MCHQSVTFGAPPPLYLWGKFPPCTVPEGSVPRDWTGKKKKENWNNHVLVCFPWQWGRPRSQDQAKDRQIDFQYVQRVLSESHCRSGPFELPLLRASKSARTCDAGFLLFVILVRALAEAWGWRKLGWLTVIISQIVIFIRQVGLAFPSRLVMPSLIQGSHSQTGTHVHGERVRRRIAVRVGRAVGEITGQYHQRDESREGAFHSHAVVW